MGELKRKDSLAESSAVTKKQRKNFAAQADLTDIDEWIRRSMCIAETKSADHTFWRALAVAIHFVRGKKGGANDRIKSDPKQLRLAKELHEKAIPEFHFDRKLDDEALDYISYNLEINLHIHCPYRSIEDSAGDNEDNFEYHTTLQNSEWPHYFLLYVYGKFHAITNIDGYAKQQRCYNRVKFCTKCYLFKFDGLHTCNYVGYGVSTHKRWDKDEHYSRLTDSTSVCREYYGSKRFERIQGRSEAKRSDESKTRPGAVLPDWTEEDFAKNRLQQRMYMNPSATLGRYIRNNQVYEADGTLVQPQKPSEEFLAWMHSREREQKKNYTNVPHVSSFMK